MDYIRLEDGALYHYRREKRTRVKKWGIFLCLMTGRTAKTGQWPILVVFSTTSSDYDAYALVEDPRSLLPLIEDESDRESLKEEIDYAEDMEVPFDGRVAFNIGGAYVEDLWPYSVYHRQHMAPGAYIKGIGLGSLLYILGPLRVATKEEKPVRDLCTISPDPSTTEHCSGRLGGTKTEDAQKWWDKAEKLGFISKETISCESKDPDKREGALFNFKVDFPDLAIEQGVRELVKTPQDLRYFMTKEDYFGEEHFALKGARDSRGRLQKSALREGFEFSQKLEGVVYFPKDSPVLMEQAKRIAKKKIRESYGESFVGIRDVKIDHVSSAGLYFSVHLRGMVTHSGELIYKVENVKRVRRGYAFANASFRGTFVENDAKVFKLCARDFYHDDLRLASSLGRIQEVPLMFPDFYANIDPRAISPEFLAFCLELNDREDYIGYIEEALEAFRESRHKPSEEYIQRVQDALFDSGVVLSERRPNPGRASLRNRHVRRLAMQRGRITLGGDG